MTLSRRNLPRLFCALLLWVTASYGFCMAQQPLLEVLNKHFTDYDVCPTDVNHFNGYVAEWYAGSVGSEPEYYNVCNPNTCAGGGPGFRKMAVPENVMGTQADNTGLSNGGYAGILNYDLGTTRHRDYLKVRLTEKLIGGNKYKIRFYVSLAEESTASIEGLGVYVTANAAQSPSTGVYTENGLPVTPNFRCDKNLNDVSKWMEVIGSFVANGNEEYLVFGCFDQNLSLASRAENGSCENLLTSIPNAAYYYVDDVELTELPSCYCNYRLKIEPQVNHPSGQCCWSVTVSPHGVPGAIPCPIYGVKVMRKRDNAQLFLWTTNTNPILENEIETVGTFCTSEFAGSEAVEVVYLDDDGTPLCTAPWDLSCQCQCKSLLVKLKSTTQPPYQNGQCCYDVYIENPGACDVQMSEVALTLGQNGTINSSSGSVNGWIVSAQPNAQNRRFQAPTSSNIIAANINVLVGNICVGISGSGQTNLHYRFYKGYAQGGQPDCEGDRTIVCSQDMGPCCERFTVELVTVFTWPNGPFPLSQPVPVKTLVVKGELTSPCKIASVKVSYPYMWINNGQPMNFSRTVVLPAPSYVNGDWSITVHSMFDARDVYNGVLLWGLEESLTFYDENGNVLCVKNLNNGYWGQFGKGVRDEVVPGAETSAPNSPAISGLQILPNPTRRDVVVSFVHNRTGKVTIQFVSLDGRLTESLWTSELGTGNQSVLCNLAGLASGTYMCRVTAGDVRLSEQVVVVK